MRAEGVSFRHAAELLNNDAPSLAAPFTTPAGGRPPLKQSTVPKLDAVVTRDADDHKLLRDVVEFYHAALKESPEALAYLTKRGLGSSEMVDHFKLGYANRTLGYRLPAKNREAGAELRGRLQKLGILRESGHEHFRGSLLIPVFAETGEVLNLYGRKIRDDLRPGTPAHLYLPGPRRGVFNRAALAASDEVILCEALVDALTFWCAGFRNVTSAYGVEGFSEELLAAMKMHKTRRVLIAYDRDEAGDKAAHKLAERLLSCGIACARVQFPKGMDANAYALAVQPPDKSLRVALANALWLGEDRPKSILTPSLLEADVVPTPPAPSPSLAAASTLALEPTPEIALDGDEAVFHLPPRHWRVRGLLKNTSYEVLRVNVLCAQSDAFHVDTFDLYAARARAFCQRSEPRARRRGREYQA